VKGGETEGKTVDVGKGWEGEGHRRVRGGEGDREMGGQQEGGGTSRLGERQKS